MLVYCMADGRKTTDVEQAIRWQSAMGLMTPEIKARMRRDDSKSREDDRVFDAAIAKFEGKDVD